MRRNPSNEIRRAKRTCPRAAAWAAAGIAMLLASIASEASAQQGVAAEQGAGVQQGPIERQVATSASARLDERLEMAFWVCDYASTDRSFQPVDAMACSVVTEDLKRRRFNGDFEAMHAWWQRTRVAAHRALESTRRVAR